VGICEPGVDWEGEFLGLNSLDARPATVKRRRGNQEARRVLAESIGMAGETDSDG